jgi:S1-C subfamily serine protease
MVGVLGGLVLLGFIGALAGFWLLSQAPEEAAAVAIAERQPLQDQRPREPIRPAPEGEAPADRAGALPLKELKAASVYIIAMTQTMYATGSGFVVRAQGDNAYVVTNHHVITPPKDEAVGPRSPFIPRGPRMPIPPRPPIRPPQFPRRPFQFQPGQGQQQAVELTVVFYSSEQREQSVAAEVLADNPDDDLALLRVTGLREVPRPIDWQRTPEPVETMTVFAFGFPFGKDLDPKKGNPAITVSKGAVSSLRQDRGELKEVQLDLDLNPGNSGGPVVDDKGALVGVAVAKVSNSKIGFAVPAHKLKRLLQGRLQVP